MSNGTLSPDGKFIWTGDEWIPAPPVTDNEQPTEASKTSSFEGLGSLFGSEGVTAPPIATSSSSDNDSVQSGVDCPYCKQRISEDQSRCHHCSGTLLYCKSKFLRPGCDKYVGITEKKSWGGLVMHAKTLGWKHYKACMNCGKEIK